MRCLGLQPEHRRGVAAVELAIVLPIFFMVVMGIVEFGSAIRVGQLVTNAARQGASEAVVNGATNASVETKVKSFVSTSIDVAASDVSVDISVDPGAGNPDPLDLVENARPKDICKVTVKVPYDKVAYVAGRYLTDTELKSTCIMRHQ